MKISGLIGIGLSVIGLIACKKETAPPIMDDDALTIVVQSDNSRMVAEKAAIDEQRKELAVQKEQLEKNTSHECLPWHKLIGDQDHAAKTRDIIIGRQDTLIQTLLDKVKPSPAAANGGSSIREQELQEKEKDLSAREAAVEEKLKSLANQLTSAVDREKELAERESRVASCEAALLAGRKKDLMDRENAPALAKNDAQMAYRRVLSAMNDKGVVLSDLPEHLQRSLKECAGYRQGQAGKSAVSVEPLEAWLRAVVIDRPFIVRKVKNIETLLRECKDAKLRSEILRLLEDETRAFANNDYHEANRLLNNATFLLEKAK